MWSGQCLDAHEACVHGMNHILRFLRTYLSGHVYGETCLAGGSKVWKSNISASGLIFYYLKSRPCLIFELSQCQLGSEEAVFGEGHNNNPVRTIHWLHLFGVLNSLLVGSLAGRQEAASQALQSFCVAYPVLTITTHAGPVPYIYDVYLSAD